MTDVSDYFEWLGYIIYQWVAMGSNLLHNGNGSIEHFIFFRMLVLSCMHLRDSVAHELFDLFL